MELTSKNVDDIFMDCLFEEDTLGNQKKAIIIEGVMAKFGLNPDAVKKHKDSISSMLKQLPDEFQQSKGGGWSFLNACNRADGVQWGEHRNMEQLVVLGIAAGLAKFQLPRDMWKSLPGGMPYFSVL